MSVFLYCRISIKKERIERQISNLKKTFPEGEIYQEVYTGKTMARPVFQKMLSKVQSGDTIAFDAVSRFSRTAEEGFTLYKELYERGVNLVFLKQPHMNTSVYKDSVQRRIDLTINSGDKATDKFLEGLTNILNNYMLDLIEKQFLVVFNQAEMEVKNLSDRTKDGILIARLNGKQIGRPPGTYETVKAKKVKKLIQEASKTFGGNLSDKEIIDMTGVNKKSYYKYKKELLEDRMVMV